MPNQRFGLKKSLDLCDKTITLPALSQFGVGYSSGQRGQTVNLLGKPYSGSNPVPTTILRQGYGWQDREECRTVSAKPPQEQDLNRKVRRKSQSGWRWATGGSREAILQRRTNPVPIEQNPVSGTKSTRFPESYTSLYRWDR